MTDGREPRAGPARRTITVVVLLLTLGACGQAPATERDPAPPARAVASNLDATARAFVELTIATDDQAVKLLDRGATRAHDPSPASWQRCVARNWRHCTTSSTRPRT